LRFSSARASGFVRHSPGRLDQNLFNIAAVDEEPDDLLIVDLSIRRFSLANLKSLRKKLTSNDDNTV
jgi:hypothetical protein